MLAFGTNNLLSNHRHHPSGNYRRLPRRMKQDSPQIRDDHPENRSPSFRPTALGTARRIAAPFWGGGFIAQRGDLPPLRGALSESHSPDYFSNEGVKAGYTRTPLQGGMFLPLALYGGRPYKANSETTIHSVLPAASNVSSPSLGPSPWNSGIFSIFFRCQQLSKQKNVT